MAGSGLTLCSLKGEAGAKAKRNLVGLGLIVALASFAYGREAGCSKAEMLAINDDGAALVSCTHAHSRCSSDRFLEPQTRRMPGSWCTMRASLASRKYES